MRRAVVAVAATIAIVVAVLRYHSPSSEQAVTQPTPAPSSTGGSATNGPVTVLGSRETVFQRKIGFVFGVVQVAVTFHGDRIVDVTAPVLPPVGDTGGRGTQPVTKSITAFAVPVLEQEVRRAQGASVHTVSGATYTSVAFIRSVQAALLAHR